ncbi:MAG: hypothetical protein OXN17_20020 [Candidatus Poribacteria bacterium]|nr:hypothetical protein [Candidatus Poribacteria bacterium]MDE0505538.1 hypothetical protein [Candidatus Poribacteria bacterium]
MEEWGDHNRRRTGRDLHQTVSHPEKSEPLAVAFEAGKAPAQLIGFKPLQIPETPPTDQSTQRTLPRVPISWQQDALRQVFQEQKFEVTHLRSKNGRLEGKQNVVQVHFIPRAFSDRAIKQEFLMICAIVHGAQLDPDTIDVVRAIAEDEDGTPKYRLETQVVNYKSYLEKQINLGEWESHLRFDRF